MHVVLTNKNIRIQHTLTRQEMLFTVVNTLGKVLLSQTRVCKGQP